MLGEVFEQSLASGRVGLVGSGVNFVGQVDIYDPVGRVTRH